MEREDQLRASLAAHKAEREKADAEMERVKACEHIAEGDEGWEILRNVCPSTAAVAVLRDENQELRRKAEEWKSFTTSQISAQNPKVCAYLDMRDARLAGAEAELATMREKREKTPGIAVDPSPPAADPIPNISITLHPLASFQFLIESMDIAPAPLSEWRWTRSNSLFYIRITDVRATPEGKIAVIGGVYYAFRPDVQDLPEAAFLRHAFTGSRLV